MKPSRRPKSSPSADCTVTLASPATLSTSRVARYRRDSSTRMMPSRFRQQQRRCQSAGLRLAWLLDSPGQERPVMETSAQNTALAESEMRATLVKLVFGGDPSRLEAFCAAVADVLPP